LGEDGRDGWDIGPAAVDIDFASRRALAAARTNQRLAVVSICKALGGGWEICAGADHDCGGADGIPNLAFAR